MAHSVVILAAGLGTRMKSETPKVLHRLYGKPVVQHVVETARAMKPEKIVVVVGPNGSAIQEALKELKVSFAVQREPKGTADALKAALPMLSGSKGNIVIMSGDAPLVRRETISGLLAAQKRRKEDVSVLSFDAAPGHAYGRILRRGGSLCAIVEDKDATSEEKNITEVNSGIYAMSRAALNLLGDIKMNPLKKEFYLTDIVSIVLSKGLKAGAHLLGDETELTGINTRRDLAMAGLYLRDRIVSAWLDKGVTFIDPSSVFISPDTTIGNDTVIYPNVITEGRCSIGSGCVIYPGSRLMESSLSDRVTVKDSSIIESSSIGEAASVGPFAHIRPGSVIGANAKIGNFVELKKAVLGRGAKASHLSYIGDAEIGADVNIGAGTITCNYDGKNKFKTTIEEGAFIGSDTQLVAPVTVGKGAYVGSGTTVTRDVPPMALALSRSPQVNIEGWALRHSKIGKKSKK